MAVCVATASLVVEDVLSVCVSAPVLHSCGVNGPAGLSPLCAPVCLHTMCTVWRLGRVELNRVRGELEKVQMHHLGKSEDVKLLEVKLGQTKHDYESHIEQLMWRWAVSSVVTSSHCVLMWSLLCCDVLLSCFDVEFGRLLCCDIFSLCFDVEFARLLCCDVFSLFFDVEFTCLLCCNVFSLCFDVEFSLL